MLLLVHIEPGESSETKNLSWGKERPKKEAGHSSLAINKVCEGKLTEEAGLGQLQDDVNILHSAWQTLKNYIG